MDSLSHLVTLLAPRGRMELRCLFGAAFAAPHAAIGPWHAPFHVVLRGECELWLPGTKRTIALRPGSLLVLPRGSAHTLRAGRAPARIRTQPGALVDLKTNVGEPDGAVLVPGARALISLDAYPELTFTARFHSASPALTLSTTCRASEHEVSAKITRNSSPP